VSGTGVPVLVSVFGVVAFVSVIRFYFTLYGIEARAMGETGWRLMFVPGIKRSRARWDAMLNLIRPRWIRHTLRETGWNPVLVGLGLLSLLIFDLVVLVTVFPNKS
jgi:hypothetical protein